MSSLGKQMQEELQRRNYSEITAECYVRHVAEFANHFHRPPNSLGAEEIKQFQLHLINDKKIAWSTYIQAMAALRFFYVKTLGQTFMVEKIPYPKRPRHLPTVLSQEEVKRLLDATVTLKDRAVFITIYGAGLRVSEAARRRVRPMNFTAVCLAVRFFRVGHVLSWFRLLSSARPFRLAHRDTLRMLRPIRTATAWLT